MPTLFAWLGNSDLRASEDASGADFGPILMALEAGVYDRLVLLSDHGQQKTQNFLVWLAKQFAGTIDVRYATLRSPTDFEDIYKAANGAVSEALASSPGLKVTFHVSPGTPAMAAVWVLLAKAKYGADLIESSRERGVRPVVVPFDLAAEFLPVASKEADEALAHLVQGLSPAAPEFSSIIYRCSAMKRVVAMAQRLAQRDLPVLIQGESGTGKELFARAIHASSKRKGAPFVAVNCGAIPIELIDSELFGHEKGAFTGAHATRAGYFEAADGGTLFLDEIGELPLQSQVRLLRVLQEHVVTRLGTSKSRKIDVRIVAATNRVLPEEVRAGRFREDVFHRIAVGILALPPLRAREGDLNLLIDALLAQINREATSQPGFKHKNLSVGARNLLLRHAWPGNVRELHNALLRASIWAPGEEIAAEDIDEVLSLTTTGTDDAILGAAIGEGFSLPDLMADVARHYLDRAMEQSRGNKTEAAKLLGLDRYLRFDVRRPPGGRPLLWPVRVWKVLYPTNRVLKLNLFQQAILGLARARCQDSSEMAELLGLDRELVSFIIATQLIPNGWMTTLGSVTSQGERVLEEAQDASEEVRMGYAYQDAISGNWLPRFTEELPEIEAKRVDERGYPVFLRDLDSGKEDRPFRLNHFREDALDTAALFDAFQRYRTDHDQAKQRDEELSARVRIESLSFVEDSAQPMWLWTWIFPDEAGPQPWLVADPFGLQQAASWLRKPLQEVLPRNDGLARYIADAVGESRSNDLSAEEWLRSLENQIDLTLLADYNWSRKVPIVEGYLASVLRRRAVLASQERSWQEDVTSLLIETHNLAESVLQWLLKAYPSDIRRLPHWKDQRDWKDGEAQYYLQFFNLPCLTDDVIKRLSEQRLDQVRTAVKRGSSSLKALLFAGLLPDTVLTGRYCLLESLVVNGHSHLQAGDLIVDDGSGFIRIQDTESQVLSIDQTDDDQADSDLSAEAIISIAGKLSRANGLSVSPMLPAEMAAQCALEELERNLATVLRDGHLHSISDRPRRDLRYDDLVAPVARARRLATSALSHLASHSDCWQQRTLSGVQPRKVLARFSEDAFAAKCIDNWHQWMKPTTV